MEAYKYHNGVIVEAFHNVAIAAKCGVPDALELAPSHPDVLAFRAKELSENSAERENQKQNRQQIINLLAALDAGTATSAQVQKALAFLIRRVVW